MSANKSSSSPSTSGSPLRLLVSGGGTGGHIFPAISIANAVKRRHPETEILFVGAEGKMEMERVPAAGYSIKGLPVAGFDRRRPWRNINVVYKLLVSLRRANKILRDFKPDIVVGVGGYASGPILKAAQKKGIPTLIQEQNSYAGVTNKLLGKEARKICVAYDNMERFFPAERIVKTGNPVRSNLLDTTLTKEQAKSALGFDTARPLVLIVGGSLGARTINDSIRLALPKLKEAGINLLWQTGKIYYDEFAPLEKEWSSVKIIPFISDMNSAYAAADLVVSRAGAGTISELQLLGKATLLVPSPNVAEDHQRKNAMALVDKGAAVMVADSDSRSKLGDTIVSLAADTARLDSLRENIRMMALPDSDEMIVDRIMEIVNTPQS